MAEPPPLEPGVYLVATPIGNMEDISERARRTLAGCDLVACEDTRRTGRLLSRLGLKKPLLSCHERNESARASPSSPTPERRGFPTPPTGSRAPR